MIHILEDLTHKIEGQPPPPFLRDPERKPSLWHLRAQLTIRNLPGICKLKIFWDMFYTGD